MNIKFKGSDIRLVGDFPKIGDPAKNFKMAKSDLSNFTLDCAGNRRIVMNVFPSLDTPTCAFSVRRFNKIAAEQKNTIVLCISKDLPFAQFRFCIAENIKNAVVLSDCRCDSKFGSDYGIAICNGALCGMLARSVFVIEPDRTISYAALSGEISKEPDYDSLIQFLLK